MLGGMQWRPMLYGVSAGCGCVFLLRGMMGCELLAKSYGVFFVGECIERGLWMKNSR